MKNLLIQFATWRFVVALIACPLIAQTDRFGGNTTLTTEASGQFRLEQLRSRWWFISPEGHGMVVLGLNHISEMKNPVDYRHTIFAQRFGTDWPRVFEEAEKQVREWGFNSAGFQAPPEMRATMPYVLITKFMDAAFYHDPVAYRDVFAPDFAAEAVTKAKAAAMEMQANPMCMAWSWSDSTSWDIALTRKTRGTDYVSFMRNLAPGEPGRVRYTAFLGQRYHYIEQFNAAYGTRYASFDDLARADLSKLDLQRAAILADDHEFLRLIAHHYYESISRPFRRAHPQGLLMGDRFQLHDHPDEVLEVAAKFIDVLGIQPGDQFHPSIVRLKRPVETQFDMATFDRLYQLTNKPIVIADHQCGFYDDQTPKTGGWYQYPSAEEAADSYKRFLHDAYSRPYIVGYFRCQYLSAYKDHIKRFKQGLLRPDGTPFEEFDSLLPEIHREVMREVAMSGVANRKRDMTNERENGIAVQLVRRRVISDQLIGQRTVGFYVSVEMRRPNGERSWLQPGILLCHGAKANHATINDMVRLCSGVLWLPQADWDSLRFTVAIDDG